MANKTDDLNLSNNGNSGILGMAFSSVATIKSTDGSTILANMFNYLNDSSRFFALKLGRQSDSGYDPTSSFSIGELDFDFAHDFSDFFFSPVLKAGADDYDYWKLPMQYLTINSTRLDISRSLVPNAPQGSSIAVLDSGTTLMLGPTVDVDNFWNSVGNVARKNSATGMWEIKCEKALSVGVVLGDGSNMKEFPVHPEDVNWAAGGAGFGWCLGGIQANDKVSFLISCQLDSHVLIRIYQVNSGDWLLGDVFMRVNIIIPA